MASIIISLSSCGEKEHIGGAHAAGCFYTHQIASGIGYRTRLTCAFVHQFFEIALDGGQCATELREDLNAES
jgi:hypothetical protein